MSDRELLLLQTDRRRDRAQSVTRRRRQLESSPKRLGDLLDQLFREDPESMQRIEEGRALAAWESIVGECAARYSQAKRLRGDTLIVAVADPLWMQQLHLLKQELLKRYKTLFPKLGVRDIFFARGLTR